MLVWVQRDIKVLPMYAPYRALILLEWNLSESEAGQCRLGSVPQYLLQVMTSGLDTDKCATNYRSYKDVSCSLSRLDGRQARRARYFARWSFIVYARIWRCQTHTELLNHLCSQPGATNQ